MMPEEMPLVEAVREYVNQKVVRFHMPGHKGGRGAGSAIKEFLGMSAFLADVTNVPGMDDLHQPSGAIHKAEELAAKLFNADNSYFLINGSSCGVMALIMAVCNPGEKILVPRNMHRSILSGIIICGAHPVFFRPVYDIDLFLPLAVKPETIRDALKEHPDARAVFLISPTYNGITSDITEIAHIVHGHGIPLVVDEAHGPHLGFNELLPDSALHEGADAVVHGTHKILTSFTQASMLHVKGGRVDRARLEQSLRVIQSTSPSYLLMASLDAARADMASRGRDMLERAISTAENLRRRCNEIPGLFSFDQKWAVNKGAAGLDSTKVTVTVKNLGVTGLWTEKWLRDNYRVQVEMSDPLNILAMITSGNTSEDVDQLINGLKNIPVLKRNFMETGPLLLRMTPNAGQPPEAPMVVSPREAFFAPSIPVLLEDAKGRVSAETVAVYPPGIPAICPGEEITAEIIDYLVVARRMGMHFQGPKDPKLDFIRVLRDH
ncbi:MAG: aminotransferase class I/II-fold pyridoxal phosphate-dependent enzyme [Bacillota bacterium]